MTIIEGEEPERTKTWLIFLLIIMNSLPIILSSFTLPQLPPSHLHALLYPTHKPIFHSRKSTISSTKRRPSPFPIKNPLRFPCLKILIIYTSSFIPLIIPFFFLLIIFFLSLTSISSSSSTHLPLPLSSFLRSSTLPQPPPHVHILLHPPQ